MVACKYQFTVARENVWNDERIGRFEIHIPQHSASDPPVKVENIEPYLKLQLGDKNVVLKTVQHDDRQSQASVHPSIFKGLDITDAKLYVATKPEFLKYKSSQIRFLDSGWPALMIGVIGLMIDGAFAIGKASKSLVVFHLNDFETGFWMGVAILLKAVALMLLFYKGLNEAK